MQQVVPFKGPRDNEERYVKDLEFVLAIVWMSYILYIFYIIAFCQL